MRWRSLLIVMLCLLCVASFVAQDASIQQEKQAAFASPAGKLYPPNLQKKIETLEAELARKPGATALLQQARWLIPDITPELPAHVSRIMGTLKFKHDQYATAVVYTPDDTGIITASRDGTVKLWNLSTGKATKTWNLGLPIGPLCLSPDGKYLAAAEGYRLAPSLDIASFAPQDDYAIHVIELATDNEKWKLSGTKSPILSLAFSSDGQMLCSGSQSGKGDPIRLWNLSTGKFERSLKSIHSINNVGWSKDGSRLFSTTGDRTIVIFDVKSGLQVQSTRERGTLYAMALSPDQDMLAVGGDTTDENNTLAVKLYSTKDWKLISSLPGQLGSIVSLAFHHDGKTLVTGSAKNENAVKVWNIAAKTASAQYMGHTSDVVGIALTKQGNNLATVSLDGSIRLWQTSQVKPAVSIIQSTSPIWSVATHGKMLLTTGADKAAAIRDLESGKEISRFLEHQSPVTSGCFRPDGAEVATGGGDYTIRLWDPATGKPGTVLTGHKGVITSLVYSPDGKRLYSASADKSIRIWDIAQKKALHTLVQHRSVVTSLALNLEGSLLASGGADNLIRIWRTHDASEMRSLIGHAGAITGLCFSPGGKLLASVGADGVCKIWDPGTRADALRTITGHVGQLMTVAFSPNNKYLATAGADETIRLWSVVNGNELRAMQGHTDWVTSVAFLSDGESLVSASVDGSVKLWAESKSFEAPVFGHEYPVRYLAMSPQGDRLASGSEDGKIILWDTVTGNDVTTLNSHLSPIRALAFSNDGKKLVSADREQIIKLWDVATSKELQSFISKISGINRLGFLQKDRGIFASIGSSTIAAWQFEGALLKPEPVLNVLGYERHCNSVAFAQDRVALGSTDGIVIHKKIVQFKPDADEIIKSFSVAVSDVTMSSNGNRLLAINQDNEFKIWNLEDKKLIETWKGRPAKLTALAMNTTGDRVLASFDSGEIVLWNDAGKELRTWKFRSITSDIIFTPNGKQAYAGMSNGVIFQLDLP
jgi:WD40 repeat protein